MHNYSLSIYIYIWLRPLDWVDYEGRTSFQSSHGYDTASESMPLRGRQKGFFRNASAVIAGQTAVSRRVYYAPKSAHREQDSPAVTYRTKKRVNPHYSVSAVKEARSREKALFPWGLVALEVRVPVLPSAMISAFEIEDRDWDRQVKDHLFMYMHYRSLSLSLALCVSVCLSVCLSLSLSEFFF